MKGALSKVLILLLALLFAPVVMAQEELKPDHSEEFFGVEDYFFPTGDPEGRRVSDDYTPEEMAQIAEIARQKENEELAGNRDWWYLLKKGKLNLADTTVIYPKFLKFCVGVYNWADKFFNGFDTDYVVGTGHRWKARLVNENWTDSYALRFRKDGVSMRMLSNLNDNLGAYIQYMAVSVGYSVDLNTIFSGKKTDHTRFETNFNCALFNLDVYYYHSSGTKIRQFTGYNDNHLINSDFPGVTSNNFGANIYYFFNHKKYSQGAAYNFGRIQRRSAGSWMLGFSYSNLDISMNFNTLEEHLKPVYIFPEDYLHLHYFSYCLLFGYGYNWVWHPKWVFNISVMPSIGINRCYEDSSDGSGRQFALNIHGRTALVYNHRALFCGIIGKITGNWYTSKKLSLFNAIEYFSLNVGFRF